jgi:hypothetical protein
MTIDLEGYRLFLAIAFFLAGAHAHARVEPYFSATFFGSALVFAFTWGGGEFAPEFILVPAVVFYAGAAATKGLVENSKRLKGNHFAHVVLTGFCSGLVVMPLMAACDAAGWPMPGPSASWAAGVIDPKWLGGVDPGAVVAWMMAGAAFYSVYKVFDHVGISRPVQTVLQFAAQPFLVSLIHSIVD